ncbi:MAG: hypothetical protein PWP15_73 [Methanothermococcus sp.]|nr:hypothetical protein [Methanothermococcus sp.]
MERLTQRSGNLYDNLVSHKTVDCEMINVINVGKGL